MLNISAEFRSCHCIQCLMVYINEKGPEDQNILLKNIVFKEPVYRRKGHEGDKKTKQKN